MIEIERELRAEGTHHFKALRLIAPEEANGLGIPTESPVFVSSIISGEEKCKSSKCIGVFKPLVYQVGYEVTAHHFHRNSGGVYHHYSYPQELLGEYKNSFNWFEFHSWVALLNPLGICKYSGFGWPNQSRSESAEVNQIKAYCGMPLCAEGLGEGVVFAQDNNPFDLCPLCSFKKHSNYAAYATRYNFKVTEEGEVLFSAI